MTKYAFRQSALALTISSALSTGAASAATITVTTATDGPVGSVSGCSLREAIASANDGDSQGGCDSGSTNADSIVFDPSLAYSTITLTEGQLEITSSLTITGPVDDDFAGLVIDGDNLSRILRIQGASAIDPIATTLNQLTLTRGRVTGTSGYGAAIRAENADLNLEQTLVSNNSIDVSDTGETARVTAAGGGILVLTGSVTLVDSQISGNSAVSHADGLDAGATAIGGGLSVLGGDAALVNSIVADNVSAASAVGTGSYASTAGGLVVSPGAGEGTTIIVDSIISGNSAQSIATDTNAESLALGGGLVVATIYSSIVGSTISANTLYSSDLAYGGGMVASRGDDLVSNSTVSGNSAIGGDARGGGIFLIGFEDEDGDDHVPAFMLLGHSTVAFNTASNGGGGIYFTQNSYTQLALGNSLVVQNGAGDSGCNAPASKYVNSLVTDVSCTGTATDPGAIKLSGLSNHGGPTPTHGLLPGSVAIDAITKCDSETTLDQRGLPRPGTGSSNCDIGAFEVQDDDDLDAIFSDRFDQ